jgi:predicted phage terminase large subunit-like protein
MKNLQYLNALSLDDIKAERCKRRFYEFFKEFWDTIESVEYKDNWHIKKLCDRLQDVYERWERGETQNDLYINVPPGSSKSSICTQLFPVWLWVRNASIRIISSSYSYDLSTAHAVKSRNCIQSDKFKLYYSDLCQIKYGDDNKTWYKNTKMGERYATSTGGTVTGMHADFIIVDDPLNREKADSLAARETANKHITETLSTRKTDRNRSVTIVIMQRLHEDDPTGKALKDRPDKTDHICLPGELTDNVQPKELSEHYVSGLLDPVRLNREALTRARTDLGSYGYAGQILQKPSPEGGGKLKKAWFNKISYDDFVKIKGSTPINIFGDTAYTDKQKNDPTALMPACYINNNLYIIHSEQMWLEFPDLLKRIPSYANQHGYTSGSRIMIEPKASGKSTVQSFKGSGYNVIELPPPEDDKTTRVSNIAAFVEAGRVFIVEGGWNEGFLDECGAFPNGSHDDQVDNLVNAINYYSKPVDRPKTFMPSR